MRRSLAKLGSLMAGAMLALTVASASPASAGGPAYFEFTDGYTRDRAVVRIDDAEKIAHARGAPEG